jgi:hypothetical protein
MNLSSSSNPRGCGEEHTEMKTENLTKASIGKHEKMRKDTESETDT